MAEAPFKHKGKMRALLSRAAIYLEREAKEYERDGQEYPKDKEFCGKRASKLIGAARSLRKIAKVLK